MTVTRTAGAAQYLTPSSWYSVAVLTLPPSRQSLHYVSMAD